VLTSSNRISPLIREALRSLSLSLRYERYQVNHLHLHIEPSTFCAGYSPCTYCACKSCFHTLSRASTSESSGRKERNDFTRASHFYHWVRPFSLDFSCRHQHLDIAKLLFESSNHYPDDNRIVVHDLCLEVDQHYCSRSRRIVHISDPKHEPCCYLTADVLTFCHKIRGYILLSSPKPCHHPIIRPGRSRAAFDCWYNRAHCPLSPATSTIWTSRGFSDRR
jgi:hypothetical protein